MLRALVRHHVRDLESWMKIYQSYPPQEGGALESRVYLDVDDNTNVFVVTVWDDLDRARSFFRSPLLREAMRSAGVAEKPDVWFLEEQPT